jgi:hypothetical protein
LVESAKVAKTAWYKFATEASEVKALATAWNNLLINVWCFADKAFKSEFYFIFAPLF